MTKIVEFRIVVYVCLYRELVQMSKNGLYYNADFYRGSKDSHGLT